MMYGAPYQFESPSKARSRPVRALAKLRDALSASSGTKLSVMATAVVIAAALALTPNVASPSAPPHPQRAAMPTGAPTPTAALPPAQPEREARAPPADVAVESTTPEARAEPGELSALRSRAEPRASTVGGAEMLAPLILTAQPLAPVRPARAQDEGDLPEESLTAEPLLLQHVADALATGEPELALSMLQTHRTRFVRPRFREQRDGLIALARCTLDDHDLHFARRFLARYPASELSARVQQVCAIESLGSQTRPPTAVVAENSTSDTIPSTGPEEASDRTTIE